MLIDEQDDFLDDVVEGVVEDEIMELKDTGTLSE